MSEISKKLIDTNININSKFKQDKINYKSISNHTQKILNDTNFSNKKFALENIVSHIFVKGVNSTDGKDILVKIIDSLKPKNSSVTTLQTYHNDLLEFIINKAKLYNNITILNKINTDFNSIATIKKTTENIIKEKTLEQKPKNIKSNLETKNVQINKRSINDIRPESNVINNKKSKQNGLKANKSSSVLSSFWGSKPQGLSSLFGKSKELKNGLSSTSSSFKSLFNKKEKKSINNYKKEVNAITDNTLKNNLRQKMKKNGYTNENIISNTEEIAGTPSIRIRKSYENEINNISKEINNKSNIQKKIDPKVKLLNINIRRNIFLTNNNKGIVEKKNTEALKKINISNLSKKEEKVKILNFSEEKINNSNPSKKEEKVKQNKKYYLGELKKYKKPENSYQRNRLRNEMKNNGYNNNEIKKLLGNLPTSSPRRIQRNTYIKKINTLTYQIENKETKYENKKKIYDNLKSINTTNNTILENNNKKKVGIIKDSALKKTYKYVKKYISENE